MRNLTDIDFLTLDLTVFAILFALMTFAAPAMMRFRDQLIEMDAAEMKNDMSVIDFCKSTIENFKCLFLRALRRRLKG